MSLHVLRRRLLERVLVRVGVVGLIASGLQIGFTARDSGAAPVGGTISITAFRDYNANGTRASGAPAEPGLGGVLATATCVTGPGVDGIAATGDETQATASGVTGSNGSLSLTVPGSPCRIEFSPDSTMVPSLASVLRPGAAGASSVQFANAGDALTVGMNIPGDYCQSVPKLAMTCFTFGDNVAGPKNTNANLHVFNEEAASIDAVADGRATAAQIGSTWGVAYQRSSKTVFAAAYLKGHTGYGPSGPWAIYKIDPATTASGSLFVDLNVIGSGGGADPHAGNVSATDWAKDYNAMGKIGRFGLGGLTVGEDDQTLWAVNLSSKTLVKMAIGSGTAPVVPTSATTIAIPSAQCGASEGASRPFAVTAKEGAIWVGGVCEGVLSPLTVPKAWVLRYDLTTDSFAASPALAFSLGYTRGCAYGSSLNPCGAATSSAYGPWTSTLAEMTFGSIFGFKAESTQQPMLTGITFVDGDMVVAFRNRDQLGEHSIDNPANTSELYSLWPAGEVLRSCTTDRVTWQIESAAAGVCPGSFSRAAGTDYNPGPGGREFYIGDSLQNVHEETAAGGVIQVPGHPNLQLSLNDPLAICSGGSGSMSNLTGTRASSAQLYADSCNPSGAGRMGKANGLGDLEALCDEAPIEIGNRVWLDRDADGLQDPDEPPLVGVTVHLYDSSNNVVGTAVTGANGVYLFGGVNNVNMASSLPVRKDTTYSVRVDSASDVLSTGPLAGLVPTAVDAPGNDVADSDGTATTDPAGSPVGTWPVIAHTSGTAGANNHTLDFGFYPNYALGNRVWIDDNESGTLDGAEAGIDGVVVRLYAADSAGRPTGPIKASQTTSAGGFYRFDLLPPGRYVVVVASSNLTGAGVLALYRSSTGVGQEANPNADGDRNDNGLDSPLGVSSVDPGGIASGVVTLGPSASSLDGEPVSETEVQAARPAVVVDGRENLTVDFGFALIPLGTTTTTTTSPTTTTTSPTTTTTTSPTTTAPTTTTTSSTTTTPGATTTTAPSTATTSTPVSPSTVPPVLVPPLTVPPSTTAPSTTTSTLAPTPSTSPVTPGVIPTVPSPVSTSPPPAPCGVISGTVFVDTSRDGVRDPRERGVKDAVVAITLPSGKTVDVRTDGTGRYETPCFESGVHSVTIGEGVSISATPTNGPRARSVAVSGSPVVVDFGFIVADVRTANIGQETEAAGLAYTGSEVSALFWLSLLMIAAGVALMIQRRRFLDH